MAVNEITASRAEYALALSSAGVKVSAIIPERITPPIVVMSPGSPYLEPATVGNEWLMKFDLVVIAANATNAKATELLEKGIAQVIEANPEYARITSIGQPYALETNNAQYLAANISADIRINI